MRPNAPTRFLLTAALCALVIFGYFAGRPLIDRAMHRPAAAYPATDFAIFYCAGEAIDAGRSPYLLEPLRGCEHRVWPRGYLDGHAEPAALPGYAAIPFALLARLPFSQATFVWLFLDCICFGVAVASAQRLAKMPAIAAAVLLFVPLALLSIRLGQLGPILAAAIFSSALLLRAGHARAAAVAALVTLVEPHIGIPILAAVLWFAPRTRLPIVIGGAVLLAAHFATLGIPDGIRYFTQVLPAMSHAELTAADQYGTVWALYRFGLSEAAARAVADLLYAAAIVASLFAVGAALKRLPDRALIVAIPAVLGLLAAPYLHDVELCGALVLPLCALGSTQRRAQWAALAAVLAVPWYAAVHDTFVAACAILAGAVFLAAAIRSGALQRIAVAGAGIAAAAVLLLLLRHLPAGPSAANVTDGDRVVLAAQSWGAYLRGQPPEVATGLQSLVPKALTWIALLAAASAAIWRPTRA